jgi:pimeloyl-ACP methyl ester carboxylesterase
MHRVVQADVLADGFRTRYLESKPDGTPKGTIVLIHDGAFGGDAATSWRQQLATFGDHHRVVAPDLLGYGGTDKAVYLGDSPYEFRIRHLAAFCREVDIAAPAHFVGVSFGGSMLLRALAPTMPALRIASLTSIGGTGGPWRSPLSSQLADYDGTQQDMARLLALMVDPDMPGFAELAESRYRNTLIPGHVEACLAARLRGPAQRNSATEVWPQQLRGCRTPVMLVEGKRDVLMEAGWSENFRGVLDRLRIEVLDTKHLPNVDHPALISQLILDFVDSVNGEEQPEHE